MENLAVPEEQDAPGMAGRLDRMGDHKDRLPVAVEIRQHTQEAVGGA